MCVDAANAVASAEPFRPMFADSSSTNGRLHSRAAAAAAAAAAATAEPLS